MKIKFLAIFGLAAVLAFGACKGSTNTNTNTNTVVVATPTVITKTNESATSTDPNMKSKVETALKAKGFTDVTVDTSTTPATLRGTVAKGKMTEATMTAQEAAGKPFANQITEK